MCVRARSRVCVSPLARILAATLQGSPEAQAASVTQLPEEFSANEFVVSFSSYLSFFRVTSSREGTLRKRRVLRRVLARNARYRVAREKIA